MSNPNILLDEDETPPQGTSSFRNSTNNSRTSSNISNQQQQQQQQQMMMMDDYNGNNNTSSNAQHNRQQPSMMKMNNNSNNNNKNTNNKSNITASQRKANTTQRSQTQPSGTASNNSNNSNVKLLPVQQSQRSHVMKNDRNTPPVARVIYNQMCEQNDHFSIIAIDKSEKRTTEMFKSEFCGCTRDVNDWTLLLSRGVGLRFVARECRWVCDSCGQPPFKQYCFCCFERMPRNKQHTQVSRTDGSVACMYCKNACSHRHMYLAGAFQSLVSAIPESEWNKIKQNYPNQAFPLVWKDGIARRNQSSMVEKNQKNQSLQKADSDEDEQRDLIVQSQNAAAATNESRSSSNSKAKNSSGLSSVLEKTVSDIPGYKGSVKLLTFFTACKFADMPDTALECLRKSTKWSNYCAKLSGKAADDARKVQLDKVKSPTDFPEDPVHDEDVHLCKCHKWFMFLRGVQNGAAPSYSRVYRNHLVKDCSFVQGVATAGGGGGGGGGAAADGGVRRPSLQVDDDDVHDMFFDAFCNAGISASAMKKVVEACFTHRQTLHALTAEENEQKFLTRTRNIPVSISNVTPAKVKEALSIIRKKVNECKFLHVCFDGATDLKMKKTYLVITLRIGNEHFVLPTQDLDGHTAKDIKKALEKAFEKIQLDQQKILTFNSDAFAGNIKALLELQLSKLSSKPKQQDATVQQDAAAAAAAAAEDNATQQDTAEEFELLDDNTMKVAVSDLTRRTPNDNDLVGFVAPAMPCAFHHIHIVLKRIMNTSEFRDAYGEAENFVKKVQGIYYMSPLRAELFAKTAAELNQDAAANTEEAKEAVRQIDEMVARLVNYERILIENDTFNQSVQRIFEVLNQVDSSFQNDVSGWEAALEEGKFSLAEFKETVKNKMAPTRQRLDAKSSPFKKTMKTASNTRLEHSFYGCFHDAKINLPVIRRFCINYGKDNTKKPPESVQALIDILTDKYRGGENKLSVIRDQLDRYLKDFECINKMLKLLSDPTSKPTAHLILDEVKKVVAYYKKEANELESKLTNASAAGEETKIAKARMTVFKMIVDHLDSETSTTHLQNKGNGYRADYSRDQYFASYELCRFLCPSKLFAKWLPIYYRLSTPVRLSSSSSKKSPQARSEADGEDGEGKFFDDFKQLIDKSGIGTKHGDRLRHGLAELLSQKFSFRMLEDYINNDDPTDFWCAIRSCDRPSVVLNEQEVKRNEIVPPFSEDEKFFADFAIAVLHLPPVVLSCDSFISVINSVVTSRRVRSLTLMDQVFLKANGDLKHLNPLRNWCFLDQRTVSERFKALEHENAEAYADSDEEVEQD